MAEVKMSIVLIAALAASNLSGYRLVWADEFNGKGPFDASKWQPELGFVRNHEDQWYQADNAFRERGKLIIEARKESRPNPDFTSPSDSDWRKSRKTIEYTSASLVTKQTFLYGRFEIRAKIDIQSGMWPAFWTVGLSRDWPASGEIDIMEYYRGDLKANFAWGSPRQWTGIWKSVSKPVAEVAKETGYRNAEAWAKAFHVWRMDWDADNVRLYVDNLLLNEVKVADTQNKSADHAYPFREPHQVMINLALGGDNGGDLSPAKFPARYELDYVRIYQKKP